MEVQVFIPAELLHIYKYRGILTGYEKPSAKMLKAFRMFPDLLIFRCASVEGDSADDH